MAKIQDIDIPHLEFAEGAAPGTPAAAITRIYAKADGLMYSKDDAGVETLMSGGAGGGSVATDAIWDAAGDLAVGSGANTAARLAKGAAGANLSSYNGVVAWNGGTSFPASPATGDRYWRSDHGFECFYNGTRWLTTTLFELGHGALPAAISASSAVNLAGMVNPNYDMWVEDLNVAMYHSTANPATAYWTAQLQTETAAEVFANIGAACSSQNNTSVNWALETAVVDTLVAPASFKMLNVSYTKVSTPGNLTPWVRVTYRLVVT